MTGSPFSSGKVKAGAISLTSMTMYLYRKTMQAVTLATAIVALSFVAQAQFRIAPPERKTPRAIGVLETFKNGSQRLVPVTFYYEKKYYDATFYHATPVPFTLYAETVYEVQQFGKPLGMFTVQSASQNQAEWFGNGKFKLAPDPATLAKKRVVVAPLTVEDSSKPVLHRHAGSEGDSPAPHPATTAASSGAQQDEDPDRPKLHRREGSGDASASGSTSSTTTAAPAPTQASTQGPVTTPEQAPEESSQQDPNRPKLQRRDNSSGDKTASSSTPSTTSGTTTSTTSTTTSTTAPSTASNPKPTSTTTASGTTPNAAAKAGQAAGATRTVELTPSGDPDHPVLRRGRPVQQQAAHDLPDFKLEEAVTRQVAVSDAGPSEVQALTYVCREEERTQLESQARELAQAELRRLAAQRGLVLPAPATKPAVAKTAAATRKSTTAKAATLPEMKLAEEQFVPYDLDYNNYATVVFSARYAQPVPGTDGKTKSWVVTVIGREDEGKMVKLYSAVSDPRELDLYPEVRLVDAVDPDGYGRAALLFREKKRDGVSWLLGRVNGYELQTVFATASR